MKQIFLTLTAFFMISGLAAQESEVTGIWYNMEKTSKIKIYKAKNGKYCAKLVWLQEEGLKDTENPDPAKRNDPLMGMIFLKNFTYDVDDREWVDGTIYDPESGKTYDCYMWFEGNKNILHVKGYVMGMKFAGREVEWTRTTL